MFRPIRTLILIVVAFLAGLLFERYNTSELCSAAGGTMDAGVCKEAS